MEPIPIGLGSFGAVYRANCRGRPGPVAVKVLISGDAAKLQTEIETMARVPPHPHVISLVGVSNYGGKVAIITEFCQGGSLHNALRQKLLSPERLVKIAMQVAAGVHHIHCQNLVHRRVMTALRELI